jgi:hypothetical protein
MVDGDRKNLLDEAALRAAEAWGPDTPDHRRDLDISGSPERSEYRCVLAWAERRLVVLENIWEQDLRRKQSIIERLDFFALQELPGINPYPRSLDGRHIVKSEGRFWLASPYIQGIPPDHPGVSLMAGGAWSWLNSWSVSGRYPRTCRTNSVRVNDLRQ